MNSTQGTAMKKLLILLFALVAIGLSAQKVDLNTASLQEIMRLPISEMQARDIYDYRQYVAFFESIFDLREIPSIDQVTLLRIRDMVVVSLYRETDEVTARREEIKDLLERLDSNEGGSEGMSDVWEDYLMTPQNVNTMHFDDLISLPNVSPVDAVAILKRIAQGDTIADMRDMRNSVGLSHYGYTNLRSYVYYRNPPVRNRLYVDAQMQYYTRYFEEGAYDMYHEPFLREDYGVVTVVPHDKRLTYLGYFNLDQVDPDFMAKLRVRYGNHVKVGWMGYSPKGETNLWERSGSELLEDSKYFAGYENTVLPLLPKTQVKLYLGHYRATYGEGLVMENTDFYSSRKTGYGFSKRILGLSPDLSRTQTYALRGAALELRHPMWGFSAFVSSDKKDALVYMEKEQDDSGNPTNYLSPVMTDDGKYQVLSYVTPTVGFEEDELRSAEAYWNQELSAGGAYAVPYINLAYRKNFIEEKLWGTHLQFSPRIGTKLGFTTYTALYDNAHFVVPDWNTLKTLFVRNSYYYKVVKGVDSEVAGLYSTRNSDYIRDYRRVIGFDGHTVLGNVSVQGEYAELSVTGEDVKLGDDPKAYLVSAYSQYENLYFLALLRHYDLNFDNPYSNAFSEHERFDDTILEKYVYSLTNPSISDLYQNSSQAQPEHGIYFETRYKFNNYFTVGRSYLDLWERLSDGRRSARFQSELEFRPLYQVAMRLRYKNQVNRYDDTAERGVSKTNEYTLSLRTFLSNRDFLEFEYRYNTVWGPPYTSLTNPADGGNNSMAAASTLMQGDYLAVNYTHNFNSTFKIQGSFNYWYGHGISHWDWEDMEIDFMGEKGAKTWIALHSRISQNLYMTLKYRNKSYQAKELRIREYNVDLPADSYWERVQHNENTIRLNLDYRF